MWLMIGGQLNCTSCQRTQLVSTDIKSVERGSFCLDLEIAKPCVCCEAWRENILNYFLIIGFQAGQEAFRSITRSYYRYVFFVSQAPFLTFLTQRSSWSSACLRHHAERHFQPLGEESIYLGIHICALSLSFASHPVPHRPHGWRMPGSTATATW